MQGYLGHRDFHQPGSMAQTSWMQSFVGFFSKKVTAQSSESCLDFSRQCLQEVRTMTSPRDSKSSKVINYEQCVYLVDRLDAAVHKASLFLKPNGHPWGIPVSPDDVRESTLEYFKILCMLAKKVKCFIQGCCKGHWLHTAVTLTNLSDCTASLGFDLKLFAALYPFSESCRYSRHFFTTDESSASILSESESVLRKKASQDEDSLVAKLRALIQNGRACDDELELATFLLERLDRFKQSSPSITPPPLQLILRERDLSNLKHMVQIGRGGYGTVHRATWLGMDVAVKSFYGTDNPEFKKEVPILAGLFHPNIVSFLCHGKDMGESCVVMELMDGDLFSLLKERLRRDRTRSCPFSVFEEFDIMLQIAEAMLYLHSQRVLHRDLKSHNILVRCLKSRNTEGYESLQVKVSDFGLSRTKEFSMTQSHLTPNTGTARWMAPELIQFRNTNDIRDVEMSEAEEVRENYPYKCDVYSFGMVCLEILTGDVPFPHMTATEVKRAVCVGERPPIPDRCHRTLKALIEKCWNPIASSRPCFGRIRAELRDLKRLYMISIGPPVLQSLQNFCSQIESFEEIKKSEMKVETDSSGTFSDLSLGPSLRPVSTSGNPSSPRPVSSLQQNSFGLAFNSNLGDNSTSGRPNPAPEAQKTWISTGIRIFTFDELESLTSNFAEINILGRGDSSVVYGGLLADYGKVAVKRMIGAVTALGFEIIQLRVAGWISLRDRHLVGMLGYCIHGNDLLLVNEYMPQGTLTQRLFKYRKMDPAKSLSWPQKLKIAMDVAEALEYMHGFDLIFLHPFLMSSNVLLDDDFNAKVSGFGLAKPSAAGSRPESDGYKAPEYSWGGWWTRAVHVYSFGVVLMELLTGRPAVVENQDLATWFRKQVWTKQKCATLHAAMDPLGVSFHSNESTTVKSILAVAELAMECTAENPKARPDMDHAVSVLRCLLNEGERSGRTGLRRVSE